MIEGPSSDELESKLYEDMLLELVDNNRTMPQRPRSHQLATESENFLRGVVPSSWVVQDLTHDYGKDFLVEVFLRGKATGLEFIVQLRATDNLRKRGDKVVTRMKVKTINYLLMNKVPSLLLIYDGRIKIGHYIWIEDYVKEELNRVNPTWETQKTVEFKIPVTNIFGYHALEEIIFYLVLRRLSSNIEPLELIRRLWIFSIMVGENKLREWLEQGHDKKIARFLEEADVKTMLLDGSVDYTDIYPLSMIWGLSDLLKKPALEFGRRMVIALIEANKLLEAAHVIQIVSSPELCELWWEAWSKEPRLELAFEMIDHLPKPGSPKANRCLTRLYQFLECLFYTEFKNLDGLLNAYLSGKAGGRFIDWLINHVSHSPYKAKKLVDLLPIDLTTWKKLQEVIDEEAEFWADEAME
mgnify:CR=1 FL=1